MAAHVKTGIEQVIKDIGRIQDGTANSRWFNGMIAGAVNVSCWTEDSNDVWHTLYGYTGGKITLDELEAKLKELQPSIIKEWENLGKPKTREEWYAKKYPRNA